MSRASSHDTVNIAAAWGQNPDFSFSGDNYALDLGTVIVPFPSLKVSKHVALTTDINANGLYSAGSTVTYSIRVVNQSPKDIAAGGFTITDPVLNQMTYVPGSTKYTCSLGGNPIAVADSSTGTPFPLDVAGLASPCLIAKKGGEHLITFQAVISAGATKVLSNSGTLKSNVTSDIPFGVDVPIYAPTMVRAWSLVLARLGIETSYLTRTSSHVTSLAFSGDKLQCLLHFEWNGCNQELLGIRCGQDPLPCRPSMC
jgi:uncharacterized repeat protein (TIGR01451 family)